MSSGGAAQKLSTATPLDAALRSGARPASSTRCSPLKLAGQVLDQLRRHSLSPSPSSSPPPSKAK
uniref:Uncharacterized protein n=1 Tax=Arundo donax TaxID=35708 RepID=A0A0A9EMI5_ARUDO